MKRIGLLEEMYHNWRENSYQKDYGRFVVWKLELDGWLKQDFSVINAEYIWFYLIFESDDGSRFKAFTVFSNFGGKLVVMERKRFIYLFFC